VLAWALPSAALLACASSRFETDAYVDTTYDFASVGTFAFQVQREKVADSPAGQALEKALLHELVARGYRQMPAEEADVLVAYDVGRYAPAKLSGANAFARTQGTLSVTVLDAPTGRRVWYGWVEVVLGKGDDERLVPEAVAALFEQRVPAAAPR
jgi:hypothetical protein